MASLDTAFNSSSSFQDTQIYSEKVLLQQGYIPISQDSDEERELSAKLVQIVESIKTFVWQHFKLVGINDEGKIPPFLIHMKEKNAFYRPNNLECFKFNDSYISCPEVVCHEFTHGIVEHLNPLRNKGEAGAINESIADIVGIVFKRTVCAKNDWKIGDIRDLSAAFNEASNWDVHQKSLLLSHAFYEASKNLNYQEDITLLQIWIKSTITLKEKTFREFIKNTMKFAFRAGSPIGEAIHKAWVKAGYSFR